MKWSGKLPVQLAHRVPYARDVDETCQQPLPPKQALRNRRLRSAGLEGAYPIIHRGRPARYWVATGRSRKRSAAGCSGKVNPSRAVALAIIAPAVLPACTKSMPP